MNAPRVSAIISTYIRRNQVQEAVRSVLAQTYQVFELIAVDGGSMDGTGQVLKRSCPQIRYVYQRTQGVSATTNRGIWMASGRLVAFLDRDDLWVPHELEHPVACLDAHPDVALVCGSVSLIASNCQCLRQDPDRQLCPPERQISLWRRCSFVALSRQALFCPSERLSSGLGFRRNSAMVPRLGHVGPPGASIAHCLHP